MVQVDEVAAKQVLSRGQQKVLVYLLHLAQLDMFSLQSSDRAIVLCDDLNHSKHSIIRGLRCRETSYER